MQRSLSLHRNVITEKVPRNISLFRDLKTHQRCIYQKHQCYVALQLFSSLHPSRCPGNKNSFVGIYSFNKHILTEVFSLLGPRQVIGQECYGKTYFFNDWHVIGYHEAKIDVVTYRISLPQNHSNYISKRIIIVQ